MKWLAVAGGLVVGAAYLGFSYFVAASERPPALAVLIGLLPMLALMLSQALRVQPRGLALAVSLALSAGIVASLDLLRQHVAWLYLVQHIGAMLALGLTFGVTLGNGHEQALCSQIAALMSPEPLDARHQRYTWQVTAAWTAFFLCSALVSAGLFAWAPVTWWSLFANVLTPVLTGAMFVVEYLVRVRVLPDRPHLTIAGTVMAYQRFKQGRR
ncbi:hypothetical protein [Aquabacterium sp.]|uniref:COG4648 family protein n=1 Tax=Aquabacterium sp. TaxID=1872578 RepID=UPI0035B17381